MVGMDRADSLGLTQQEEKHYISTVDIADGDLERLGLGDQPDDRTLAHFCSNPVKCLEQPQQAHFLPHFNVEAAKRTPQSFENGDGEDFFWTQIFLGSKLAAQACTEAQTAEGGAQAAPIRSMSCLSSIDRYTPGELRAISRIVSPDVETFTPSPAKSSGSLPRSRSSRLPVLESRLKRTSSKKESSTPQLIKDEAGDSASVKPSPSLTVTPLNLTPSYSPGAKSQGTLSRANSLRGASTLFLSYCSILELRTCNTVPLQWQYFLFILWFQAKMKAMALAPTPCHWTGFLTQHLTNLLWAFRPSLASCNQKNGRLRTLHHSFVNI